MDERVAYRLLDIKTNISLIRALLAGKSFEDMYADAVTRAAFERFLEIISEASRHVPEGLRQRHGADIPWRQVADLGNVLRHTYFRTDAQLLWQIYETDLDPLERAVDSILAEIAPNPPSRPTT